MTSIQHGQVNFNLIGSKYYILYYIYMDKYLFIWQIDYHEIIQQNICSKSLSFFSHFFINIKFINRHCFVCQSLEISRSGPNAYGDDNELERANDRLDDVS